MKKVELEWCAISKSPKFGGRYLTCNYVGNGEFKHAISYFNSYTKKWSVGYGEVVTWTYLPFMPIDIEAVYTSIKSKSPMVNKPISPKTKITPLMERALERLEKSGWPIVDVQQVSTISRPKATKSRRNTNPFSHYDAYCKRHQQSKR